MATTGSPILRSDDLPSGSAVRPALSTLTTARSSVRSTPSTVAAAVEPSENFDVDLGGVGNDVGVGGDLTVAADDEAGAGGLAAVEHDADADNAWQCLADQRGDVWLVRATMERPMRC